MKKYAQDIDCILPPSNGIGGLYISNLQVAQNLNTLKKYNIKAVITVCRGHILKHQPQEIPYYLYFQADDHESYFISQYFQESSQFIQITKRETNVLVHCMAGISRSVTLVLAYLIIKQGHTTQTAYNLVKKQRKKIYPNSGFMKQLKKLQQKIKSQTKQYSLQIGRPQSLKTSMATNQYQKNNKYSSKFYNNRTLSSKKYSSTNSQFFNYNQYKSYLSSKQSKKQLDLFSKLTSKTTYQNMVENTFQPTSIVAKQKGRSTCQDYDKKLKQDIKKLRSENLKQQQALSNKNNFSRNPLYEIFYGN